MEMSILTAFVLLSILLPILSLPCLLSFALSVDWHLSASTALSLAMEKNSGKSLAQYFRTCLSNWHKQDHITPSPCWSPNSTDLHLIFYVLCQHTNTKDIAGQSVTHLPEHYLHLLHHIFLWIEDLVKSGLLATHACSLCQFPPTLVDGSLCGRRSLSFVGGKWSVSPCDQEDDTVTRNVIQHRPRFDQHDQGWSLYDSADNVN